MLKLCIDARMILSSGIGTYLKSIISYLCNDFEIILIGSEKEIDKYNWRNKVKVINSNVPIYSIKEQIILFLKVPTCDVFWSPHYNIPVLPIKAKRRLCTIHDVYHLAHFDNLSISQKIYAYTLINLAVKLSNKIVTVSQFSKNEILKFTKIDVDKIHVVYNGIEDLSKEYIKGEKNKRNESDKYLLFVGNVKPHKNLKNLIQAFIRVKVKIPYYKLIIVGKIEGFITSDNYLFNIFPEEILKKNDIIFTGEVSQDELISFYKAASLFVFPSLYEGFGLPPIEAMSVGCPVLVSNTASMPEVCKDAAIYFNPYSIDDIELSIYKAINNIGQLDEMVKKGYENIKRFSWAKAALETKNIINSMI